MATSAELKDQLSSLTTKRKNYEQRRDALQNLHGQLTDIHWMEGVEINRNLASGRSHISAALKGVSSEKDILDALTGMNQSGTDYDTNVNGALDSIESEISRCENRMDDLAESIAYKKKEISGAEKAEKEAAGEPFWSFGW